MENELNCNWHIQHTNHTADKLSRNETFVIVMCNQLTGKTVCFDIFTLFVARAIALTQSTV